MAFSSYDQWKLATPPEYKGPQCEICGCSIEWPLVENGVEILRCRECDVAEEERLSNPDSRP